MSSTNENQQPSKAQSTKEKPEDAKLDVVAEPQEENTNSNVALPLPGTQSTYQRVEKGTRTALLYWDGWLSAQDAKAAEDDPDYYSKTGKELKRNLHLKKNWTYGKDGKFVYIRTGFVGLFDKANTNASSYLGSSYGNVNNSKLLKLKDFIFHSYLVLMICVLASGPSVGTIWDLQGKPGNNSAYYELKSYHGGTKSISPGGKLLEDDQDFYSKTLDSKIIRNPNLKRNFTYDKNGNLVYLPTGFVGLFDKASAGGNRSSYGSVAGGNRSSYGNLSGVKAPKPSSPNVGGNRSSYGNASGTGSSYGHLNQSSGYGSVSGNKSPKPSAPSVGNHLDLKRKPGNKSAYMEVSNSRGGLSKIGSVGGIIAGKGEEDHDFFSKPGSNSNNVADSNTKQNATFKKNWYYEKDKKIVYVPTGFIGTFDKPANRST